MPLTLTKHKSYNPYSTANRAQVRRDEERAKLGLEVDKGGGGRNGPVEKRVDEDALFKKVAHDSRRWWTGEAAARSDEQGQDKRDLRREAKDARRKAELDPISGQGSGSRPMPVASLAASTPSPTLTPLERRLRREETERERVRQLRRGR